MVSTMSQYSDSLGGSAEDKATMTGCRLASDYGHMDQVFRGCVMKGYLSWYAL